MSKILSPDAIEQYRRDGYYFPLNVLNGGQVAASRDQLEAVENNQGKPLQGAQRIRSRSMKP